MVKEFLDFAYSLEGQTILAKYGSLPVRGDIAKEALKTSTRATRSRPRPWPKAARPTRVVFNDLINSPTGRGRR